jgi:hypothetical protein
MPKLRIAVAAGAGLGLALGGVALAGTSGGQGTQSRQLVVTQPNSTDSQCQEATNGASHGFAHFNAPGKPGATIKFNGEVSLKRGAPDTLYTVYLVPSGGDCTTPAAMIMTNGQGNGNAHLAKPGPGAGTYYVVLQTGGSEQFATTEATVI